MTYKKLKKILNKMKTCGCLVENLTVYKFTKFYKYGYCINNK